MKFNCYKLIILFCELDAYQMVTLLSAGKRLVVITFAGTEAKFNICPMFVVSANDGPKGPSTGLEYVEFDRAFL